MAVIAHVILRGVSREQYDAVRAETGWLERLPDGGLAHLAYWVAMTTTTSTPGTVRKLFRPSAKTAWDPPWQGLG